MLTAPGRSENREWTGCWGTKRLQDRGSQAGTAQWLEQRVKPAALCRSPLHTPGWFQHPLASPPSSSLSFASLPQSLKSISGSLCKITGLGL